MESQRPTYIEHLIAQFPVETFSIGGFGHCPKLWSFPAKSPSLVPQHIILIK